MTNGINYDIVRSCMFEFKNKFTIRAFVLIAVLLAVLQTLLYPITNIVAIGDSPVSSPVSVPASTTTSTNSVGLTPAGAPLCNDQKPQSAPLLLSSKNVAPNEVTLFWNKAGDPVTYYLLNYGENQATLQYGNPNIGGKDTTSFTVKNLNANVTYYFRVRAGNNCAPGDYSNVIAVKAYGEKIEVPASGFKKGVLSTSSAKTNNQISQDAKINTEPISQSPKSIIARIIDFVKNILQ